MDLILWRHCDAEDGVPDALRRLTPRGVRQAARIAGWLAPRLPERCRILVSPALRAQQTARALSRAFETVPELDTGASVAALLKAARWPDAIEPVLVVGHQPTLGRLAALLLDGEEEDRSMAKGAVWWLTKPREANDVALKHAVAPDSV